jgi:hypothetical protein
MTTTPSPAPRWPPATASGGVTRAGAAGGRALVLGGGGSAGNAWRVLVLSPLGGRSRTPVEWGMHLATQAGELRARGSRVETIGPDGSSRDAFGSNLMDPATRPPAAGAGYHQGRSEAGQLTEFWP